MLLVSNSRPNLEAIMFLDQEFMKKIKNELVLSTQNRENFLKFNLGRRFFSSSVAGVPNKSFGIAYLEQNFLSNEFMFLKVSNIVTAACIFKYLEPWSFQNFFAIIEEAKRGVAAEERVKEEIDKMKESYQEKIEVWKEDKKILKEAYDLSIEKWKEEKAKIKESNKKQKEEWQIAYDSADEAVKKFIIQPADIPYPEEPAKPQYAEKPTEPVYPSLPKVRNIREERLDNTLAWKILRRFRFCKVEGSQWGILIKRSEDLSFSFDNVSSLSLETISYAEFLDFIEKNDKNHAPSNNIKQSFTDFEAIELMAQIDSTFEEMSFSEETNEDIILPPLAPIKPMHAASMLAGGIGEFYKEVILNNDRIAIKAAIVKELVQRDSLINGKQITEIVETQNQKLGVYNLEDFNFKMLG